MDTQQIDVMVADASHEVYVDTILETIRNAAAVRGTGIAERTHEYVATKMKEGKAIIALCGDTFAGFTYIESWGNKQYVATSGLIVHPDDSEYTDTLIFRVQRYLYEKGEYDPDAENSFAPALVNRIDRNTCGIVIAAKTAVALRILNEKLKHRELEKHYLCLVYGRMPKTTDLLEGYLDKNESQNRVYISQKEGEGRRIATRYTVLGEKNGVSLLDIDLLTGRTHQIRAHLASVGHPLVGDGKYGKNEQNKRYGITKQALCSYRLIFRFTTDAAELSYLQDREFTLDSVWFADAFYKGEIRPKS